MSDTAYTSAGEKKQEPGQGRRRLLAAAIAAVVIAVAAFLLWPAEPGSLMAAAYKPYPMYLNAPVGESPQDKLLETAIANYESGDYAAALPAFQGLIAAAIHNAPYHFYAGICQLELGRPIEASIHLEEASNREEAQFQQAAEWYLALAYLRQDNKKETARRLLEKIIREEGVFSQPARKLLKEVE